MNLNKSAVAHRPFPFCSLSEPISSMEASGELMKQTFPLNKNMFNH